MSLNENRSKLRAVRKMPLMLLALAILLQYQNCAPAGGGSAVAGDSSPVSIIDKNNQGFDVSFVQKQVTIQASVQAVNLDGACSQEQDGAIFQWQLKNAQDQVLGTGSASCRNGSFNVAITPTQTLNCDQPYQVTAQIGTGQAGEVLLTRKCAAVTEAPVSQTQLSLASDSLQARVLGTKNIDRSSSSACLTEKRDDGGSGCSIACYSTDGVELQREALPTSACDL